MTGNEQHTDYWLAETRAFAAEHISGELDVSAAEGAIEVDPGETSREARAEVAQRFSRCGFTVESETSEATIRIAADPTRLAQSYRDVETVDASEIEEGDSVRVVDDEGGKRIQGTVTAIETEAGRYGVTIRDAHDEERTAWQYADRRFQRFEEVGE